MANSAYSDRRAQALHTKLPPTHSSVLEGIKRPPPFPYAMDTAAGNYFNSTHNPKRQDQCSPIDYDDVFGGPLRYATLMLWPQSRASATLDEVFKAPVRVPSIIKASVLPIFELPICGDDDLRGESALNENMVKSLQSRGVFKEAVDNNSTVATVPAANLPSGSQAGTSRSKPSSQCSSRHMSPAHPAASSLQDVIGPVTGSFICIPPPQNRSAAGGKSARRCSFSTFDTYKAKSFYIPAAALENDPIASSLPSSPPQEDQVVHRKRILRSNSGNSFRIPVPIDVDDIFDELTQKKHTIPLPDVQYVNTTEPMASTAGPMHKLKLGGSIIQPKDARSDKSVNRESVSTSSPSSNQEQGLYDPFVKLRTYKHTDSRKYERVLSKFGITLNNVIPANQPLARLACTKPPPAPCPPLKHKSWKDLTLENSGDHINGLTSLSSVSSSNSIIEATVAAMPSVSVKRGNSGDGSTLTRDRREWIKKSTNSFHEEKTLPNSSTLQPAGIKLKAKSAMETVEMEERELKALLASAWKINANQEKEKQAVKHLQGIEESQKDKGNILQSGKGANKQSKEHQPQQDLQCSIGRGFDLHWKQRRRSANRERHEFLKKETVDEVEAPRVISKHLAQTPNKLGSMKERKATPDESEEPLHKGGTVDVSTSVVDSSVAQATGKSKMTFETTLDKDINRTKAVSKDQLLAKAHEPASAEGVQTSSQVSGQLHEIKHWAAGKEGNIRALLSNLQHVLWPNSGWRPVPLTDLIEEVDVKKAYRKATLFLHPDKLQQRGSTIQQKLIAETVFLVLQEAWNTFNITELL